MKGVFGILVLAAGQAVYVSALAVPSLFGRQESSTNIATVDLATIIGTLNLSATPDVTSTFSSPGLTIPTALVMDNITDTATDIISTTSTPTGTVTVTVTAVDIITTNTDPVTHTIATDSFVTVSIDGAPFGGQVGQVIAESAPTGGAVVTVGGDSAFGGVVGVVQVSPSTSTVFITATSVVTVIASANNATDPAPTEPPPQGDGAFGGVVGSQIFVSNLVSTASAFSGFGGVAGFVSASPQTSTALDTTGTPETTSSSTSAGGYYVKRADFTTAVNITATQTGTTFFPCPYLNLKQTIVLQLRQILVL